MSLNGPKISCPKASPIMLKVRASCTIDGVAEKYSAIAGKVGRYMSVTNGPKAVSAPRNMSMNAFEFLFMLS